MKSLRNYTTLLISTLLLCFASCKGPQGEPGPQGETGATGQTGATGATGATGSANVIQVTWSGASDRSYPSYPKYKLPSGVTTKDAMVVVYITVNGVWLPLPYDYFTGIPEDQLGHYYFTIRDSENAITLSAYRIFSRVHVSNVYNVGMRAVIIPASILKNGRKAAIDYSNYEEVKKAYNLPD